VYGGWLSGVSAGERVFVAGCWKGRFPAIIPLAMKRLWYYCPVFGFIATQFSQFSVGLGTEMARDSKPFHQISVPLWRRSKWIFAIRGL
jgi:hypothetical protein